MARYAYVNGRYVDHREASVHIEDRGYQFAAGVYEVVAYVSQVCTLLPGDVIFTGTPPGVGAARKPPVFMKPGDTVAITVEHVGTLENPIVAAN